MIVGCSLRVTLQDQFFDYMMNEAIKQDIRVLIENKAKFLLVSCPFICITACACVNRFMHHLVIGMLLKVRVCSYCKMWWCIYETWHFISWYLEVLVDPAVTTRLADTKVLSDLVAIVTLHTYIFRLQVKLRHWIRFITLYRMSQTVLIMGQNSVPNIRHYYFCVVQSRSRTAS